ncbi:MAG: LacI family DNA-binding transcriptional regulator [Marinifilaceae bacterium]|nr:LacI family DNA-binding transcriptional regulator [Marinifilaceae bacterium]
MAQRPITIKDIAEKLNISVSTVSRALKDNHEISAQTRKAVQDLAKELGYKPNPIAVALKTHKSYTIGVVVPQIVSTFFATVVRQIEEVADSHGYNVLVMSSNESMTKEKKNVDVLLANRADGIILSFAHETDNYDHVKMIQNLGIPLVLFDRTTNELEASKVVTDSVAGGFQAVQHLIFEGCKRIALLMGPEHINTGGNRMRGYIKALETNGMTVKPEYIYHCTDFSTDAGKQAATELLSLPEPPDAFFGISDDLVIGAMDAVKEKGLSIPEDVALVGFSNTKRSRYISPTLSSINQFPEKIGKAAAEMLFEQIVNSKYARVKTEIVSCELVVRDSSNRKGLEI